MTSLRRSTSVAQRDGAVRTVYEDLDASSYSKPSHSRAFLIFGRLLNSFLSSLGLVMESDRIKTVVYNMFHLKSSRPVERSKVRGLCLKGVVFRFFIFFLVGLIIGFTPIPMVDQSKNNLSGQRAFSFQEPVIGKFQTWITSVDNDILFTRKSLPKEHINIEPSMKLETENKTLNASYGLHSSHGFALVSSKLLIIVTPTYSRPFQSFYLNRLAQTLRNVPHPLVWIVVEMSTQSDETVKVLRNTGVMYRHLVGDHNVTSIKNTVIQLRNVALYHIERHQLDGIVLFADDDKIYSPELFDEMVEIRRFGTWPVGVFTENKKRALFEGPVCKGREIVGWHTHQSRLSQRFHVDLSGFAFNSTILWDPKRWHRPNIDLIRLHDSVRVGFQASKFVEQLVEDESQMESLSENCSRILVWHLHLEAPQLLYPNGWLLERNLKNLIPLKL